MIDHENQSYEPVTKDTPVIVLKEGGQKSVKDKGECWKPWRTVVDHRRKIPETDGNPGTENLVYNKTVTKNPTVLER